MMKEDRLQVLRMIESGKISAEEGLRLLEAYEGGRETPRGRGRWLRVKVSHLSTGKHKANVNVPLHLVETGLRFVPGGVFRLGQAGEIDVESLLEMVRSGLSGRLLDVTAEDEDVRVEIDVD
ncbi:MAG: hypothetical protein RDU89_07440 [bacterium]|nr:hypothetical protein [bacterium]